MNERIRGCKSRKPSRGEGTEGFQVSLVDRGQSTHQGMRDLILEAVLNQEAQIGPGEVNEETLRVKDLLPFKMHLNQMPKVTNLRKEIHQGEDLDQVKE